MARKNYSFEKRQRELAKKKKQEDKREQKAAAQRRKARDDCDVDSPLPAAKPADARSARA